MNDINELRALYAESNDSYIELIDGIQSYMTTEGNKAEIRDKIKTILQWITALEELNDKRTK